MHPAIITELAALLFYALLPLAGIAVVSLPPVRRMTVGGRLATATAAGAVVVPVLMFVLSLCGVRWTARNLAVSISIVCISNLVLLWKRSVITNGGGRVAGPVAYTFAAAFLITIAAYASLTARASCTDLTFFWAPKAIGFAHEGRIDVKLLRNPDFYLMHPDYPPLLPLIYAVTSVTSEDFPWFAALASSTLFIAATFGIVRGITRDDAGSLFLCAVLTYSLAANYLAGCAEPLLLLFETLALTSITFLKGRSATLLTAVGFAGAVWTKVEGSTFVIAVLLAALLVRRGRKTVAVATIPAALLLGAWLTFAAHNQMLDAYSLARKPVYLQAIPTISLRLADHARRGFLWIAWIAPIVTLAFSRNRSRSMLPLTVAGLSLSATVFFYTHVPDAAFWIDSSANRTLLPTLTALCIAAIAARDKTDVCQPVVDTHSSPDARQ